MPQLVNGTRHDPNVSVWFASVSAFAPWLAEFESVLSLAEQARASAFRGEHLRTSYVVRHGLLRIILGKRLGRHASEVEFDYTKRGKPFSPGASQFFSVSHSGDLAMFAIGSTPRIGVDIEQIRRIPEFKELAFHYFSVREYQSLLALPPTHRQWGFLAYWTAKEAMLKATGEGIGGLGNVETLVARHSVAILRIGSENAAEWQLRSFRPTQGYLAAVAVKQATLRLHFRRLNPELASLWFLPRQ